MSAWISVRDRLPQRGEWVLAYRVGAEVPFVGKLVAWTVGDSWISYDGDQARPDYWMPITLPAAGRR